MFMILNVEVRENQVEVSIQLESRSNLSLGAPEATSLYLRAPFCSVVCFS